MRYHYTSGHDHGDAPRRGWGRGCDHSPGLEAHRPDRRFARDPLDGDERHGHDHGPSRHGPSRHGPSRHGPSQHGPSRHDPSRHGLGRDDPGRHGPGRHGRRRLFDHGDLRFILLRMIADKPAHGYDLIKALEERMGGGYSPSPGVIYPTLTLLEEQGYADMIAEAGKKLYQVTEQGLAFLRANQATLDAIQARIDVIARERNNLPPAPIIRAIENLKMALRLRLSGGLIPPDRVAAIAAAIDAAAAEAERV